MFTEFQPVCSNVTGITMNMYISGST